MLRVGEVAKMFGVTTMTIRRWTQQGILKGYRVSEGKQYKYEYNEVREIFERYKLNDKNN